MMPATKNTDRPSTAATTAAKPIQLRWESLRKSVPVVSGETGLLRSSIAGHVATPVSSDAQKTTKVILDDVSGTAEPGQVLALMGPSGSGKTTLLNCLSFRAHYDGGTISVNGAPVTSTAAQKRLKARVAYVKQSDIFFEHLTVRDQLAYTAFLRLQGTREEKLAEVDRVISLLRLQKCQASPIRFCSGGEKKRVNIGTELLTSPSICLLDEPTSGLDSTSAVALIRMLQQLARSQQKTIVTSIHQPSSGVFRSFDKLLMLADGHVVYFGTPRASLDYLRARSLGCPDGYNAADHWMDLLVQDSSVDRDGDANEDEIGQTEHMSIEGDLDVESGHQDMAGVPKTPREAKQKLIEAWDKQARTGIEEEMDNHSQHSERVAAHTASSKYSTSWWTQYTILTHRAMRNSRSAIFTPLNLTKSFAVGVVCGLMWFQLDYTESTVNDRSSYFFFTMTFWCFDSMFGALMAFPQERQVILKERSSKSYHLSAYFMAKTTSEAPTRVSLPFIYMVVSYWLAGISKKFSIFVLTTLCSLLSVVAGESIGLLVGASIYDVPRAMAVATVVALALMLLGGFFVEEPPSWIAWGRYLSPFKYAYDASRRIVFSDPMPCDSSNGLEGLCTEGVDEVPGEEVADYLGAQGSAAFNAGMLIVTAIVPRYIAYLALRSKKEEDR